MFGEVQKGHYRMVVPAPPARPPAQQNHRSERVDTWTAEPEGVDWLMIFLVIVGLVGVMGLIPLWRSVYRRYTVPPVGTTPSSYRLPVQDRHSDSLCAQRPGYQKVKATENVTSLESSMVSLYLVAGLGAQAFARIWRLCSEDSGLDCTQSIETPSWCRTIHQSKRGSGFRSLAYGFQGRL